MLAAFPLLAFPVALYNLVMLTVGGSAAGAAVRLSSPMIQLSMPSHTTWTVNLSDLFVAGSLIILFAELLKSAGSRNVAILNHSLSMLLFVGCLAEFLLLPACASSTFFLISLMVVLDGLAGFIATVIAGRREMDFRGD